MEGNPKVTYGRITEWPMKVSVATSLDQQESNRKVPSNQRDEVTQVRCAPPKLTEKPLPSPTELTDNTTSMEECHYRASNFLPGWSKVGSTQFLIDTVCTTNPPCNTVFNQLPDWTKKILEEG